MLLMLGVNWITDGFHSYCFFLSDENMFLMNKAVSTGMLFFSIFPKLTFPEYFPSRLFCRSIVLEVTLKAFPVTFNAITTSPSILCLPMMIDHLLTLLANGNHEISNSYGRYTGCFFLHWYPPKSTNKLI